MAKTKRVPATKKTDAIDSMDALSSRLTKLRSTSSEANQHLVCPMAKIIKSLDQETGKCLYDVLNDPDTATTDIIRQLRNSGIRIARQTVVDYRLHYCPCGDGSDKCGLDAQFDPSLGGKK